MDSAFKVLPLYQSSAYTMITLFFKLIVFFVFALLVTTVIVMRHCGQSTLCPRQFEGLCKYCVGSLEVTM